MSHIVFGVCLGLAVLIGLLGVVDLQPRTSVGNARGAILCSIATAIIAVALMLP